MRLFTLLCLLLAGAIAVSAAEFCQEEGWKVVDSSQPEVVDQLAPYLDLAVEEFVAGNGTLACPDTYQATVTSGCVYADENRTYFSLRMLFAIECESADTPAVTLDAQIQVPLTGSNAVAEVTYLEELPPAT